MTATCAWCGKPAAESRTVEPEQYAKRKNDKGELVDVLVKRAIVADVCAEHVELFERADRVTELLEQRDRLHRERRKPQANTRHIDGLLEGVHKQLRELGWVDTRAPRKTVAEVALHA